MSAYKIEWIIGKTQKRTEIKMKLKIKSFSCWNKFLYGNKSQQFYNNVGTHCNERCSNINISRNVTWDLEWSRIIFSLLFIQKHQLFFARVEKKLVLLLLLRRLLKCVLYNWLLSIFYSRFSWRECCKRMFTFLWFDKWWSGLKK